MDPDEKELKLLEILNSEEIPDAAGLAEAEVAVENAFPHLDDEARKTMARVMMSNLPTPEEIEQAEKTAQHNAQVQERRDEKLRRRAERRQANGGRKEHRKRRLK